MTTIDVRNPRTGENDYQIPVLSEAEIAAECKRLREGQSAWQAMGVDARIEVLTQFSAALNDHRDSIIDALTLDTGRLVLSEMELDGLRGYTGARCSHAASVLEEISASNDGQTVSFKQQYVPYQLLAVISPWNYPLILSFLDAVPALLAGCAVIIKPSEVTPRFIDPVIEAIRDVPELNAVLGLVPGDGSVGQEIVKRADAVVFTGSIANGRKVAVTAAESFIPAMLELGGKDPAIVLQSADLDNAAHSIMRGAIVNTGQACFAIERIYVEESVYEQFTEMLCALSTEIDIDYPDISKGHIGPFISGAQADIVQAQLDDAAARGAKILTGGVIENNDGGLWLRPTVMVDVDHSMKIMQEETFAPVLPIMKFSSVEEAIALANDTKYGLSAAIFGAESDVQPIAREIDAGGIYINDVDLVGEVGLDAEKNAFKCSGLGGSRYGPDGILRFMRKKALVSRHNPADKIDVLARK